LASSRAVAETYDAHANGFGSGRGALGARRLAENLIDGFEDFGSVLRDETDGFSVDDELLGILESDPLVYVVEPPERYNARIASGCGTAQAENPASTPSGNTDR